MSDIYGINRIAPRGGFRLQDDLFRGALHHAIDLWAFSPKRDIEKWGHKMNNFKFLYNKNN